MRKALLLPALFLIVVAPIWVFVLSGAGTHMSGLLLYPFASPWWLFLPYESMPTFYTPGTDYMSWPGTEYVHMKEYLRLLAGCTINVALLAFLGFLIDRWAASRRASR